MTVTYTSQVASEKLGGFFRLLFRWRGSIYSVLYGEITIFVCLYYLISVTYRFALNDNQKVIFESLCSYFNQFADYVPVTFVVGFYVIRLIARRWTQWENIPFPDKFAFDVSSYVLGNDLKTRILRRTLVRYTNLGAVLCFRDICLPVKKRFPTLEHLVTSGLMTVSELEIYEKTCSRRDSNWWIPFHWSYTLLTRAYKEGKVPAEGIARLQDRIFELRDKCWTLFGHDWIQVPMVYTQVVTLAVYMFMFASLFGRQVLEGKKSSAGSPIELYVPFFTILQIVFYLGWLKVGEVLISPMGMDADDFEINYIIDRCVNLSYNVVDYHFNKLPPLEKDLHWDSGTDTEIPYTEESQGVRDNPFRGSVAEQNCDPADPNMDHKDSIAMGGLGEFVRRFSVQQMGSSRGHSRNPSVVHTLTSFISRQFSRNTDQTDDPTNRSQNVSTNVSPKLKKSESVLENGIIIDFKDREQRPDLDRQDSVNDWKYGAYQNRLSDIKEQIEESPADILHMLASKDDEVIEYNANVVDSTSNVQETTLAKQPELDQIIVKRV